MKETRRGRLSVLAAVLLFAALASLACSKQPSSGQPASTATPLLGQMMPVMSVKELMESMIDPLSDNIFDAVWWDNSTKGLEEHKPRTDEDWEKVKIGAVTVIEGIELLKVARPFAPPGDVNNSVG